MNSLDNRHHFRLDRATTAALDEICRHTFATRSSIMRRYVQEGVAREAEQYAEQTKKLLEASSILRRV